MSKIKLWVALTCFVNALILFFSFLATWKKERSFATAFLVFSAASTCVGTHFLREYEKDAHTTLDEPLEVGKEIESDVEILSDNEPNA